MRKGARSKEKDKGKTWEKCVSRQNDGCKIERRRLALITTFKVGRVVFMADTLWVEELSLLKGLKITVLHPLTPTNN